MSSCEPGSVVYRPDSITVPASFKARQMGQTALTNDPIVWIATIGQRLHHRAQGVNALRDQRVPIGCARELGVEVSELVTEEHPVS